MVTESVRRVYVPRLAEMKNKGIPVKRDFLKTTGGLFCIGFILFSFITLWGEELIGIFLGNTWRTAGRYVTILAPWLCTLFMLIPSSAAFVVFRRQELSLGIQVGVFIARITVFGVAYVYSFDPERTLHLFVMVNVFLNIAIIIIALHMISHAKSDVNMEQDIISDEKMQQGIISDDIE